MGLLAFLSRWLKRAGGSSSAASPKRPHVIVLPDEDNASSSSLDASPLQAGIARFSPSLQRRHASSAAAETETASPPRGARQQPSFRPVAAIAVRSSPSPQQPRRKPFAELSNKVKREKGRKQLAIRRVRERNKNSTLVSRLSTSSQK